MKRVAMIGFLLCAVLSLGYAQQNKNAPPAGKKEHIFKGKVEKIDLANKTFTVNGQKVEGWMDAMTMTYPVDKPDVLKTVKVGDQIMATVYEGDMTLHNVMAMPPDKMPVPDRSGKQKSTK